MNRAVFLDADGVLNIAFVIDGKPTSPISVADLKIPAEVKPALDRLKSYGYLLICITNKPDVEEGKMTQEALDASLNQLRQSLPLDDIFVCYSRDADCYKPKPGLILEAVKKYDIDLSQSYMIGDRWRDIGAGQNAVCKTIWIDRSYSKDKLPDPVADYTVSSLTDAVDIITIRDN